MTRLGGSFGRTRLASALIGGRAVAAVAAAPAAAVRDRAPAPGLATPEQASLLANGPAVQGAAPAVRVSPEQALAAASEPGAQVEVAAGMTPAQAVGLAPVSLAFAKASGVAPAAATAEYCWEHSPWVEWGTWPYQQRVTDHT